MWFLYGLPGFNRRAIFSASVSICAKQAACVWAVQIGAWEAGDRLGLGVCAWSGLELVLSLPAVLCCSSLVLVFSVYPGNIKTFAATCFQM